ncbi:MAG: 16S rRNA (guanine(527)-N(7))-methyltransferase RsmG [Gammaproteobacteria bacterium]|nr:16S rRNA (guanine(527)-N(7))-methyltransferase RsmG [Gammaproteobacteria bacterium]
MREQLTKGLDILKIEYDESKIDLCMAYCQLLLKWNKSFNLTAIKQPKQMVSHLLLDSLSILPFVQGKKRLLDVGSGAGLPGVPLAIFMPASEWVLCDSNGKKTRFIQQASAELGLKNISVVNSRVQDYHQQTFEVILSKAYASLADFVQSVNHLCTQDTVLLTLKSGLDALEKKQANVPESHIEEVFLSVPGVQESRSVVIIKEKNL